MKKAIRLIFGVILAGLMLGGAFAKNDNGSGNGNGGKGGSGCLSCSMNF